MWTVSPVPWALGPALLGSTPRTLGHVLQPFRKLGCGVGAPPGTGALLVAPGAGGHPRPAGILPQLPASAFPSGKVGDAPAPPGRLSCPGGPHPGALARLLGGLQDRLGKISEQTQKNVKSLQTPNSCLPIPASPTHPSPLDGLPNQSNHIFAFHTTGLEPLCPGDQETLKKGPRNEH